MFVQKMAEITQQQDVEKNASERDAILLLFADVEQRLLADRAVIRLVLDCDLLMLRNEHVVDGTHVAINTPLHDQNITVIGGTWEKCHTAHTEYGSSGRVFPRTANKPDFYGVFACMLFNNMEGLSIFDVTVSHAGDFAIQIGNVKKTHFENIWFKECYADGVHVGGNCENLIVRRIFGEVGDDIVAFNAYDWQTSSVTFDPIRNVLCEQVYTAPTGLYRAFRLVPGVYIYDDGEKVDCAVIDMIVRQVYGIRTFKLYFQTPPYWIGSVPERGEVGTLDRVFFEDIDVTLDAPIDAFPAYCAGDPVRGAFAAFEIGAKVGYLSFEGVSLQVDHKKYPYAYFLAIGPKSIVCADMEAFDPYVHACADTIVLKGLTVNHVGVSDVRPFVREIAFDDINRDGVSTGKGEIRNLIYS